jgi:GT2 family glycosyltransferase/predicted dehydrogenase
VWDDSITVIMLSRDRLEYTRRSLTSLDTTVGDIEWIVVDNGSRDGSRDYLRRWARRSGRQLIENEGDSGPAGARNLALARASGRYILFVDNDVLLDEPDWANKLVRCVQATPNAVGASPLLLFPGSSGLVQCAGGGLTKQGRIGLLHRGDSAGGVGTADREQAWAPAAALLLDSAAVREADGFDTAFDPVAILEDVDLCYRLRSHGARLMFVGGARLRHFEGTTFQHLGEDIRGYWRRHNRVIRQRWAALIAGGPFSDVADIGWRPVEKDYRDLGNPVVRAAGTAGGSRDGRTLLPPAPEVPRRDPVLRVGIIGCDAAATRGAMPGFASPRSPETGDAAPHLAFGGAPYARVTGIADPVQDRASAAARRFSIPHTAPDGDRLLNLVPMDAVAMCSPDHQVRYATTALTLGMHVLVEPSAGSMPELDELLAVRSAHPDLCCVVNLPWVYHPAVARLRHLAAGRRLGTPQRIRVLLEYAQRAGLPRGAGCPDRAIAELSGNMLAVASSILGVAVVGLEPRASTATRHLATAALGTVPASLEIGWNVDAPRFSVEVEGSKGEAMIEMIAAAGLGGGEPSGSAGPRSGELIWRAPGMPPQRETISPPPPGVRLSDPETEGPYRGLIRAWRTGDVAPTDLAAVADCLRHALCWAEGIRLHSGAASVAQRRVGY